MKTTATTLTLPVPDIHTDLGDIARVLSDLKRGCTAFFDGLLRLVVSEPMGNLAIPRPICSELLAVQEHLGITRRGKALFNLVYSPDEDPELDLLFEARRLWVPVPLEQGPYVSAVASRELIVVAGDVPETANEVRLYLTDDASRTLPSTAPTSPPRAAPEGLARVYVFPGSPPRR